MTAPALDRWLADPALRVSYRREASVSPGELWAAAQRVTLDETRRLGPLVRWRIPGLPGELRYLDLFRSPPFVALHEDAQALVSGLCGRIWTLRRDYPELASEREYLDFADPGTVRVLFANWIEPTTAGAAIVSETRVAPIDRRGRLGLAVVRPLVSAFANLISTEALTAVVRTAERRALHSRPQSFHHP